MKNETVASQKSLYSCFASPFRKSIYTAWQKKLLIPNSYSTANHLNLHVNSTRQALWWTHPNVFITLYELWVSKETSLQYRFHQSKIHHIQKEEAQNRQVYDDCNLHNASTVYARIVTWPPQSLSKQQGPRKEYIKIVKSLLIFGSATRWLKTHEQRKEKPKHSLVLEGFGAHRCYLGTVSLSEALLKTLR